VGVDSRTFIASNVEIESSSACAVSDPFVANGMDSTLKGSGIKAFISSPIRDTPTIQSVPIGNRSAAPILADRGPILA
jgi:hypothetical protein